VYPWYQWYDTIIRTEVEFISSLCCSTVYLFSGVIFLNKMYDEQNGPLKDETNRINKESSHMSLCTGSFL
jgi:hypothetical protein